MEDQKIIDLFFLRSERAIAQLAEKYEGPVRRLADNILRSRRDAEECANDTWLAIWNSIPPRQPENLGAYVMTVARNLAVSRWRRNSARRRNGFFDAALEELEGCLAAEETAETALDARELGRDINEFLAGRSREDRILFLRRYWFSDSVAQIAQAVGMPANRVSVRLYRIREDLKRYLTERGTVL